jgi:hypothetical protein
LRVPGVHSGYVYSVSISRGKVTKVNASIVYVVLYSVFVSDLIDSSWTESYYTRLWVSASPSRTML